MKEIVNYILIYPIYLLTVVMLIGLKCVQNNKLSNKPVNEYESIIYTDSLVTRYKKDTASHFVIKNLAKKDFTTKFDTSPLLTTHYYPLKLISQHFVQNVKIIDENMNVVCTVDSAGNMLVTDSLATIRALLNSYNVKLKNK